MKKLHEIISRNQSERLLDLFPHFRESTKERMLAVEMLELSQRLDAMEKTQKAWGKGIA